MNTSKLPETRLDNLVNLLINGSGSHHVIERAIRLYEFQVAIFYPESYIKFLHNENDSRGPIHRLRSARIRAAIRLRDHFKKSKDKSRCLRIIAANGGLAGAMDSRRPGPAHEDILEYRELAKPVAAIVKTSYSYARTPGRPLHRGIIHAAKCMERKEGLERTTINGLWRHFRPVAVFLYLLDEFSLMPPNASESTFAAELLAQTKNINILRRFFRAYQHLHKILTPVGYRDLPNISVELRCAEPELPFTPIEVGLIEEAFRKSKNEREG
jgi:hypothetical protein